MAAKRRFPSTTICLSFSSATKSGSCSKYPLPAIESANSSTAKSFQSSRTKSGSLRSPSRNSRGFLRSKQSWSTDNHVTGGIAPLLVGGVAILSTLPAPQGLRRLLRRTDRHPCDRSSLCGDVSQVNNVGSAWSACRRVCSSRPPRLKRAPRYTGRGSFHPPTLGERVSCRSNRCSGHWSLLCPS